MSDKKIKVKPEKKITSKIHLTPPYVTGLQLTRLKSFNEIFERDILVSIGCQESVSWLQFYVRKHVNKKTHTQICNFKAHTLICTTVKEFICFINVLFHASTEEAAL